MIKILKVTSLPETLEANTIYIERNIASSSLVIHMTDDQGQEVYTTSAATNEQLTPIVTQILAGLADEPNGVATVDASGLLSKEIGLNAQDMILLGPDLDYVWEDIVQPFEVRSYTGGNNPSFGSVGLGNMQGLLFHASTMNQVWADFHIRHDIAMGTKLYPHVHWMPTTNDAGGVRWGFEYTVAKGHQQQVFHEPVTVYATQFIPANSKNLHCVTEVSEADAIPATNIEPDSYVKIRIFRDALHADDSYPNYVHAWCSDLHYQRSRLGTMNRAPNFFGS